MGDLSIKQKTEHQRLSALMQNVKLSSLDFSKSNVKVDFNSPGKHFEECQKDDVSLIYTFTNFALDFQFDHWFEVASTSIESESGVGTFSIKNAYLKVEFKPYLNAERLRMAIIEFDFDFADHSLELRRGIDNQLNDGIFEQFAGIYLEHMRKQI
jgi:hypothetical protein